jgi:transcriptional regulator with XRE-family HTH domain
MAGEQLRAGREKKGWNQARAARHLGVSQPYLSLLERGERRAPERLARKAADIYGLSAAALPLEVASEELHTARQGTLARDLAALGYPGLAYLGARQRKRNPAEVLLSGLNTADLDSRLVEALPWVVWNFPDIDWRWVTRVAKLNDLQNRLGFVTDVARRIAEKYGEEEKTKLLAERTAELEWSRLAREDTLCHDSLTAAERRWLREHRSAEAEHWGLLTDLAPEHLSYAA